MLRYRTSINYNPKNIPYSDNISHPKIIEVYNSLLTNHLHLIQNVEYVIIRINFLEEVWMDFISKSEPLLEVLVKIPHNIYWNHSFLYGTEYIYEKFLLANSDLVNNKLVISDLTNKELVISQYQRPFSFFQTYQEPRLAIYNYLQSIGPKENLMCIGGEFYMYSQIVPHKTLKCLTDCPDLTFDALYNLAEFPISHVNYSSKDIGEYFTEIPDLIIVNVSRTGLKSHMANIIKKMNREIIYIGCKESIVQRDLALLGSSKQLITYYNFSDYVFLFHLN